MFCIKVPLECVAASCTTTQAPRPQRRMLHGGAGDGDDSSFCDGLVSLGSRSSPRPPSQRPAPG